MHFQKILVTGCGGDIGLGVGRILKEAGVAEMVVGCDITDDHAGRVFFDACFCVPRADDPSYADALFVLVAREGIDLVIPMSEPELRLLAAHAFFGRRDLFLTASERYTFLSSSIVREVAQYGAELKGLVPDAIIPDIEEKAKQWR